MNNKEVRTAIFESNLKKYQIAEKAGICWSTLSRWLQTEMSSERKERILNAISELKAVSND